MIIFFCMYWLSHIYILVFQFKSICCSPNTLDGTAWSQIQSPQWSGRCCRYSFVCQTPQFCFIFQMPCFCFVCQSPSLLFFIFSIAIVIVSFSSIISFLFHLFQSSHFCFVFCNCQKISGDGGDWIWASWMAGRDGKH